MSAAEHQAPARIGLTVLEVAAHLGCSRSKAFELLRLGKISRMESPGRETLVDPDSVARYRDRLRGPKPKAQARVVHPKEDLAARRRALEERRAKLNSGR